MIGDNKMKKTTKIDMSGILYKNWKILHQTTPPSKVKNTSSSVWWLCQCVECGEQKALNGSEIRGNRSGACRCKSKISQNTKKKLPGTGIVDETGKKYNKLTVISFAYTKNSKAYWNCKCDCGTELVCCGNHLRTKQIQSCGCLNSRKEEEIRTILQNNLISFEREYSFEDLRDTNKLRFDFAIFQNNNLIGLIEYQGVQHYEPSHKFNNFGLLQKHDKMKQEYCANKNIPLLILDKRNLQLEEDILNWLKAIKQQF